MLDRRLEEYAQSNIYPFHMPGHKRKWRAAADPYAIDITEIDGFDNLHHAEEVLKDAQERAAELYGSRQAYYLVNGSTCGLLAAIGAACRRRGSILVARNCHKAVYHGIYMQELTAHYVYPKINAYGIACAVTPEQIEKFKAYVEEKGYEYYSICAPIMEGTKELMNAVWNKLQTLPPIKEYESEPIPLEALVKEDENSFKITEVEPHYFLVEANWFPKVLKGIDIEDYEALQYMQRVLEKSGIFNALRERGIEEGDIVSLYDIEFEYVP